MLWFWAVGAGLNLQCQILQRLFQIVETGVVTIPLWGAEQQFPNNQTFVRGFVTNLIGKTFQTVTPYVRVSVSAFDLC